MSSPFYVEEVEVDQYDPRWEYWDQLRNNWIDQARPDGYITLESEEGVVLGCPVNGDPWIMSPQTVTVFRAVPNNSGTGKHVARIKASMRFQQLVDFYRIKRERRGSDASG